MPHPPSVTYETYKEERAVIVTLSLAGGEEDTVMRLAELRELTMTAGASVVSEFTQSRRAPDKATYIGPGKVEDLKGEVAGTGADLVIFDDELSPTQQRNLTEALQHARPGPHAADLGYLRPARPDTRRQAAGRAGPAQLSAAPTVVAVYQV